MQFNKDLFNLPQDEIKRIGVNNLIYGSLTDRGLKTLTETLNKIKTTQVIGFDLGCGDGELIHHLKRLDPESEWDGVEISDYRVQKQKRDVNIWQGDFLTENFRPYNVLHADNLCLEDDIAEKLEEKIALEFSGIYITYRTPKNYRFLKNATNIKTVLTETTWTKHPIQFFSVGS